MQAEINAAKEAIQQCDIAIADYGKSLRELNWSCFDYALERIGRITKESEFLIDLLDNEDLFNKQGMFNDRGNSVMGLHAISYDTYMDEADKYAEQIQAINKEIENDPYDTALIERREALIDLQQQAIKAAESEKDAITSLVEEGIKAELASIKELISAYTDSMESARSLYDYQKKVKKQAGEITSLEKQLAAYSGDTSEENRARLQKLTVDLNSAKEDLQETQYEQYVKDQKKLLDDLYTNYETVLNARLDDVDGLISSVIDSTNANADTIKETIETVSEDVGYTITHEFSSVFAGSNDLVAKYGDSFDGKLTNIHATIQSIESYFAKLVSAGDDVAAATTASATPTTATVKPEPTAQPQPATPATPAPTTPEPAKEEVKPTEDKKKIQIVNGNWYIRKGAGTSYSSVAVARKGETYEYGGDSTGSWNSIIYKGSKRWVSKKGSKLIGYAHGGFIADMQQIAMQNGDDMITMNTLKKGEAILTPEQAQQFKKLTARLPQLQGIVDTTEYLSKLSHNDSVSDMTSIGDIAYNINIPIEHVQDYNDLVAQMQHDGRFEKLIQSMTVDRIVGGSKFAKYKQKF